jgi:glycine cleavage system H protein
VIPEGRRQKMATVETYEFPDDLYYTREHVWARVEGDVVTIGLSSFGQELAGKIVFVEAPRIGRTVAKDEPFMSMESGKWVGRVKAPVGGTIAAVNEELEWESTIINLEPYAKGWLARIKASTLSDLDDLMRAGSPEFAAHLAAERAKYKK